MWRIFRSGLGRGQRARHVGEAMEDLFNGLLGERWETAPCGSPSSSRQNGRPRTEEMPSIFAVDLGGRGDVTTAARRMVCLTPVT